ESVYCKTELEYALALNKPVMPLMPKKCEIPSQLQHIQVVSIDSQEPADVTITFLLGLTSIASDAGKGLYPPPTVPPKRPTDPKEAVVQESSVTLQST